MKNTALCIALYVSAVLISATYASLPEQYITSTVTVSATYIEQQPSITNKSIVTTPSAFKGIWTTQDLIGQMSQSHRTIITNGASLQVVQGFNSGIVTFQVKNKNGIIIPVSDVVRFTQGSNSISSGSDNYSSGQFNDIYTYVSTISYDDTSLNKTNWLKFYYSGLTTNTTSINPSKVLNRYSVSQVVSEVNATGEGSGFDASDKIHPNSPFVISSAAFTAIGSGSVTLK
jgi:hypothetical protein